VHVVVVVVVVVGCGGGLEGHPINLNGRLRFLKRMAAAATAVKPGKSERVDAGK
jgi:hypothetical protein